jgi:uncharacterized MAPEG superfamily protein
MQWKLDLLGLSGFVLWTVALAITVASSRAVLVLQGKRAANGFVFGVEDEEHPALWRLTRAHANCLENLPIFVGLVLLTRAAGVDIELSGPASMVVFLGRLGQSGAHLWSTAPRAVHVRFTFHMVQLITYAVLGVATVRALVA